MTIFNIAHNCNQAKSQTNRQKYFHLKHSFVFLVHDEMIDFSNAKEEKFEEEIAPNEFWCELHIFNWSNKIPSMNLNPPKDSCFSHEMKCIVMVLLHSFHFLQKSHFLKVWLIGNRIFVFIFSNKISIENRSLFEKSDDEVSYIFLLNVEKGNHCNVDG